MLFSGDESILQDHLGKRRSDEKSDVLRSRHRFLTVYIICIRVAGAIVVVVALENQSRHLIEKA